MLAVAWLSTVEQLKSGEKSRVHLYTLGPANGEKGGEPDSTGAKFAKDRLGGDAEVLSPGMLMRLSTVIVKLRGRRTIDR